MRELLCAAFLHVPIDVVMEAKTANSGMTREEVRQSLVEAEKRMEKWGLRREMETRSFHPPAHESYAEMLFDHLFRHEPLEWSNIPVYQSVFLRVLAGRLVTQQQQLSTRHLDMSRATDMSHSDMGQGEESRSSGSRESYPNGAREHALSSPSRFSKTTSKWKRTMASHLEAQASSKWKRTMASAAHVEARPPTFDVQAEGLDAKVTVTLPRANKYHLFVSPNNLGAAKLVEEASAAFVAGGSLLITDEPQELVRGTCACVLLYLNSRTWTSGEATDALVREVLLARGQRIEFLLAHEHPGIESNYTQEPRYECEFDECVPPPPRARSSRSTAL
jgi:hypothetical protein